MPKSATRADYDVVIVGGGVYGILLGLNCRAAHQSTVLIEKDRDLLARASSANQARVHRGYHYPRSLVTGFRSGANFGRFLAEFKDCIDDRFTHYYAVGGHFSKVTARQFEIFCDRIGAPLAEAPEPVARLFDADRIEAVFEVQEAVFNATILREGLRHRLEEAKVEVRLGTEAVRVGKRKRRLSRAYAAGERARVEGLGSQGLQLHLLAHQPASLELGFDRDPTQARAC